MYFFFVFRSDGNDLIPNDLSSSEDGDLSFQDEQVTIIFSIKIFCYICYLLPILLIKLSFQAHSAQQRQPDIGGDALRLTPCLKEWSENQDSFPSLSAMLVGSDCFVLQV